jgi:rRNA maturation endonuclease Nob1
MVCRNICENMYSKIIVGQSHYSDGKKYCRRCERYMSREGKFCACCGMQLRTTPVRTQYKVTIKGTEQTGDDLANGCLQRR